MDDPTPVDPPRADDAPPQAHVPQGDTPAAEVAPVSQPDEIKPEVGSASFFFDAMVRAAGQSHEQAEVKAPEVIPELAPIELAPEPVDPRDKRVYMRRAFSILHDNGRIEGTYYSAGGGGAVDIEGLYHGQRFDSTDALFRLASFTPEQRDAFLFRMKGFLGQPDRFRA